MVEWTMMRGISASEAGSKHGKEGDVHQWPMYSLVLDASRGGPPPQ